MNRVQIIILILSGVIGLLAFGLIGGYIGPGVGGGDAPVTGKLVVWGSAPEGDFQNLFDAYKIATKTTIGYQRVEAENFTSQLTKAIARNEGPDVIIQNVEWIMANRDILSPAPRQMLTVRDYQTTYIDVVADAFIVGDSIWALPLWVDPLVLYWNKDIFNVHAIASPPKNWTEVKQISNETKNIGDGGLIKSGGIALGRAQNIPLFKDIMGILLLQLGGDIEDSQGNFSFAGKSNLDAGVSALKFYTDFGKSNTVEYTWNTNVPEPRELFSEGKLAMMLDYISYMPTLKGKNPHLNFDVSLPPQLDNAEFPIYTASVGGTAVPLGSKNISPAWQFAKWMNDQGNIRTFLKTRVLAPARRDLMNNGELAKNDLFPLLRKLALNARRTHDTYPTENSRFIKEMIEAVADNRLTPTEAIGNAQNLLNRDRSRQE